MYGQYIVLLYNKNETWLYIIIISNKDVLKESMDQLDKDLSWDEGDTNGDIKEDNKYGCGSRWFLVTECITVITFYLAVPDTSN